MVRPDRDRLSGTVEVDETFIGGERSGKRGRGAAGKVLVFIAVEETEKGIGRIRLSTLQDASGFSLAAATMAAVAPGSTIRSDGWDGYNVLPAHGYTHCPILHKNAESGDATPLVHLVDSLFKHCWLGTNQGAISLKHLPYYLDEFTFRFNRRTSKSRGLLFYRLIQQALQINPVPAAQLTQHIDKRPSTE